MSYKRLHEASSTGRYRAAALPPINYIFKLLQTQVPVCIWMYEQLSTRIEGKIRGFDEFMNIVLDEAVEVKMDGKKESVRVTLGQILLKGENVALIQCKQNLLGG